MATIGRLLKTSESRDALRPKSKLVFHDKRQCFNDKRVKPIVLSLEGITRHSGANIDDKQETPLFNTKANLSVQTNDSIQALEFIMQNCTQTESRTDNELSEFFKDSLRETRHHNTPGTAHFKMSQQLLELSVSNIESDEVSRKISFDTTRSFAAPTRDDSTLSNWMDSIEEIYNKIVIAQPLPEMKKDSMPNSDIFPEEIWVQKRSIEHRKIEAMLDKPTKVTLILPPELRQDEPPELPRMYWQIRGTQNGKRFPRK